MSTSVRPSIFTYQDVLVFLKDIYKFRKHSVPGFSYDVWAKEMEIKSRSYLRALIMGTKPLQIQLLPNLLKGVTLNDEECGYFVALLHLHLAPTPALKVIYLKEVFTVWNAKARVTQVESVEEFLADSLAPAVFTYLSFDDHSSDVTRMAQDFQCSEHRIQLSLRNLIWNRLVEGSITEEGLVQYQTVTPYFKVPNMPGSSVLKKFHVEGLKLSQQSAELPSELRKLYSTFVALSEEQFKQTQGLIEDFNSKLLGILEDKSVRDKKIYRFNQQLFPVSEKIS